MTAPVAIHFGTGGRPRCGHRWAACMTGDEGNVTCYSCLDLMAGERRCGRQRERLGHIEDYLYIGGDRMSAAQAAARLGVSVRTVVRYRAELRRHEDYRERLREAS